METELMRCVGCASAARSLQRCRFTRRCRTRT